MVTATFDAVVVGAGPAGSIAALVLARGGARVALIDKANFARDKACGDLVGPRAVALMTSLGLTPPSGRRVGEMVIVGPTGRQVLLPARAGLTYPDHGLAIARVRFDAWLRDEALAAGAEPVTARVSGIGDGMVELDDGRMFQTDVIVGADGAHSVVAAAAGLVNRNAVLLGFAQRSYIAQEVDRPIIALWDSDQRGHGFPGYGWLFPGENGAANIGLGLGLRADRSRASVAVAKFDSFCDHLRDLGLLSVSTTGPRLGGWLKMGMVGTVAAGGKVLLVGDAAGLVNPLQGEGIAPAMTSAACAAEAFLADPATAAVRYRRRLAAGPGRYAAVASPLHAAAITGSPRRVGALSRLLTAPGFGRAIAAPWALTWNDLLDGAPGGPTATASSLALRVGRLATSRSAIRRRMNVEFSANNIEQDGVRMATWLDAV